MTSLHVSKSFSHEIHQVLMMLRGSKVQDLYVSHPPAALKTAASSG